MTITIDRGPDYLGGKYAFWIDGKPTRYWVANIRRQLRAGVPEDELYAWYPWLTREMVAAAAAFDWPAQASEPRVDAEGVHIRCVCGEWSTTDPDEPVACICGRRWVARVTVEGA